MTTVYFIRHCESDFSVGGEMTRPLTEKGAADRRLVTEFLSDKDISAVLSSPYRRAADTVADFAEKYGHAVETADGFRERGIGGGAMREADYYSYIGRQWADFSYRLPGGESLGEVQERNIAALNGALERHRGKAIAIGTHGMALSAIINHYDKSYGYEDFAAMARIMPWAVRMDFDGNGCARIERIDLFRLGMDAGDEWWKVGTEYAGTLKSYMFVVIFARYRDKWVYCRARDRGVFETAGGHIEEGETPLEAAKRELYEETGAAEYEIEAAFDYTVRRPRAWSAGQAFFARIGRLGDMPDYEMAEIGLFDSIPDRMRFPEILPALYRRLQMWLNLQSAKDELWDVYDSGRNLKGRTHRRGDPLPAGDYHLVAHVWLRNGRGEFLITRRAPSKGYPGMWECTGGSAVAGDDSMATAVREVREETGLEALPENGKCVLSYIRGNDICDIWLFRQDFDLGGVMLQENETDAAKYASECEIRRMIENREFLDFDYLDELFAIARLPG